MNKVYKTLGEFVREKSQTSPSMLAVLDQLELGDAPAPLGTTFFTSLLATCYETSINSPLTTTEVNTLFCEYIYPRYKDMAIAYKEDDEENSVLENNCKIFMRHLVNKIRTTYEENKILIDAFNANKTALMNGIKASSQTKYNDTPQTKTTAGVVSYDDTHNTTVTNVYNESDGASKIARLAEIDQLIRDYYDRWMLMVTRGLFIYE